MTERFEEWAIVELFGHQRIAGRVSEQTVGGTAFVRVDVPAREGVQPMTRLFGQGAIYSMTIVDEETAQLAAKGCMPEPMSQWTVQGLMRKALPTPGEHGETDVESEAAF
jgi:hypothetical protein